MIEQLIRKNCHTGENEVIFPKTVSEAVKDIASNKTLDTIINEISHIYLQFKDNSKTLTRLQISPSIRKKGLLITYTTCKDNILTERYTIDDISDEAWGNGDNWLTETDMIKDVVLNSGFFIDSITEEELERILI